MFKAAIRVLLVITLITGILVGGSYAYPPAIHGLTRYVLSPYGFDNIHYKSYTAGWDYISFSDVGLDPDEINTVKRLTFVFHPLALMRGRLQKIVISAPELIASLSDDKHLVFDGWLGTAGFTHLLQTQPKEIILEHGDLTLLTDDYGGIALSVDALATLTTLQERLYDVQSSFSTQQKSFSLHGKANGSFSDQFISLESDLERGKIDLPAYKISLTRLSGWGRLSYDATSQINILAEIQAGGLRFADLPWSNAAMSFDYNNQHNSMDLSAHSVGVEGLELALSTSDNAEPLTRIHAPNQSLWNAYINANNIQGEELNKLVDFLASLNTEIELQ